MLKVSYKFEPSTYVRLTRAIADIDAMTAQTARTIGVAARAGYKAAVPSVRVGKAVTTKNRKVGPVRTVRTGIVNKPMGPPVHGRDPGTNAVGRWLDKGTKGPIFRTDPTLPFMHWGHPVPFVAGQKAQAWVREARDAGDHVATAQIILLNRRIDGKLRLR